LKHLFIIYKYFIINTWQVIRPSKGGYRYTLPIIIEEIDIKNGEKKQ